MRKHRYEHQTFALATSKANAVALEFGQVD